MNTDRERDGRAKERHVAAGRGERFSGRAPGPKEATRDHRRRLAKIAAASVLAHGCLLLGAVLLDEAPKNPAGPAREIPVEVVTAPAPPEKSPVGETTQSPGRVPRQMLEKGTNPKPADDAMSDPNPGAAPTAPQVSARAGPGAEAATAGNDIGHQESAREHPPAARLSGGGASQNAASKRQRPAQADSALPFNAGPDRFRAAALPLVSKTGGEAVNYRFVLGSMLERVKHYPKTARRRGAKGAAVIGFVLDLAGKITSISLLRSSGEADLDAESLALVNRAAPFPPPPPGAQVSFAIEVAFGMGS
ncbi:MAG: TonB family protein [Beijerinckiaceae bacterium]